MFLLWIYVVRQVETEGNKGDDCEYAFGILDHSNVSSDEKIL